MDTLQKLQDLHFFLDDGFVSVAGLERPANDEICVLLYHYLADCPFDLPDSWNALFLALSEYLSSTLPDVVPFEFRDSSD